MALLKREPPFGYYKLRESKIRFMRQLSENIANRVIPISLFLTTIAITPFYSSDPINIPRLVLISIFGIASLLLLIKCRKHVFVRKYLLAILVTSGFLFWIITSAINSKLNFLESFFGVTGRQTGLLAYFCLLIMMLYSLIFNNNFSNYGISIVLIIVGAISNLYSLLQSFDLDPLEWINQNNQVIGLFGNPNFQSSFSGISAIAAFSYSLSYEISLRFRLFTMAHIFISNYVILKTASQQGFLVFLFGGLAVFYLWIKSHNRFYKFRHLLLAIISSIFILTILDILQKSPWQPIIYKPSVSFRGDFWRTALKMTMENPVFGVGLDGFRDNYRFYRDQLAANRNPNATVDSAHNIFLDISASGGIPLLMIYALIVLMVLVSAIKVISREEHFNFKFAALFGAWLGYTAQSIISINQIAMAIWGWTISGAIIGYEIRTRDTNTNELILKSKKDNYILFIGAVIGLVIALPVFVADGQFRTNFRVGDVVKIEKSVQKWPQSVTRMNLTSAIFINAGFPDRALKISLKASELFPNNFEVWQEIYFNPTTDPQMKLKALYKMREIDPLNPNLE